MVFVQNIGLNASIQVIAVVLLVSLIMYYRFKGIDLLKALIEKTFGDKNLFERRELAKGAIMLQFSLGLSLVCILLLMFPKYLGYSTVHFDISFFLTLILIAVFGMRAYQHFYRSLYLIGHALDTGADASRERMIRRSAKASRKIRIKGRRGSKR